MVYGCKTLSKNSGMHSVWVGNRAEAYIICFHRSRGCNFQASWASVGDTNTTWSGYHTLSKPSLSALAENFKSPSKSAPGIGADSPNLISFPIFSPRKKFPSHYKQNKRQNAILIAV